MKTSKLKAGAAIEVKLDMSDCLETAYEWQPATYGGPSNTLGPGWHRVVLKRSRRINSMTGCATTEDDQQGYLTNGAFVHAQRIRLPKEKR